MVFAPPEVEPTPDKSLRKGTAATSESLPSRSVGRSQTFRFRKTVQLELELELTAHRHHHIHQSICHDRVTALPGHC